MFRRLAKPSAAVVEDDVARPVASGEEWLGRNTPGPQRLWERLNPRHRRTLVVLARALVLHQAKEDLPTALRGALRAALDDLERLVARIDRLLRTAGGPGQERPQPPCP